MSSNSSNNPRRAGPIQPGLAPRRQPTGLPPAPRPVALVAPPAMVGMKRILRIKRRGAEVVVVAMVELAPLPLPVGDTPTLPLQEQQRKPPRSEPRGPCRPHRPNWGFTSHRTSVGRWKRSGRGQWKNWNERRRRKLLKMVLAMVMVVLQAEAGITTMTRKRRGKKARNGVPPMKSARATALRRHISRSWNRHPPTSRPSVNRGRIFGS
mmetsp:Transcript_22901/g.49714  ORF Transcript_22901/g.49714 Transcript_22901/m.49714 type:complete len:209 (-) Transcript_22901:2887-3513(-)